MPKELIRIAEEKGINIVDLVLSEISKSDPSESMRIRLDLARKYISEAREYLAKGDAVQASEKAYKAAEETVKALAEKYNLPEHQSAVREGRWYTYRLGSAVSKLKALGDWVLSGWGSAYFLHVYGFHEAKLSVDDVAVYMSEVEKMIKEAEKILASASH
ncbi:PaREP1 family protein [Caldivirga maquilingensis]|uniref:PaREP1 family protein n=1 Tax=Caldivirga maquilingensis TaxID=76887 RepID=UPI00064E86F3